MGQFASDGKMVTRSGTIEGGPGIRAYMAPFFADTSATLAWEPRSAEAGAAADLGYTVGRYETTRRTRAGLAHETGTYVTLWRRADGRWRVALDIGTPDE